MYGSNANNCTSVFEAAHKDVKKCKTNQQTGVSDKQRLGHQLRVDKATSVASSLRELEGHSKRILEVWVDLEGNEVQEMARTSAREQRVADILDAAEAQPPVSQLPEDSKRPTPTKQLEQRHDGTGGRGARRDTGFLCPCSG